MLRTLKVIDRVLAVTGRDREDAQLERWSIGPDDLERSLATHRATLGPDLFRYSETVSSPDMAISLESAALLMGLCDLLEPTQLLDTGSGFSSFVLRRWAAARRPAPRVVSVDDDAVWLERTRSFLTEHGLSDDNTLLWPAFESEMTDPFDLIFHDLGSMPTRARTLGHLCRRLAPGGFLQVDDFHKHRYRLSARRTIRDGGLHLTTLRGLTLDGFGRFAALARRAA